VDLNKAPPRAGKLAQVGKLVQVGKLAQVGKRGQVGMCSQEGKLDQVDMLDQVGTSAQGGKSLVHLDMAMVAELQVGSLQVVEHIPRDTDRVGTALVVDAAQVGRSPVDTFQEDIVQKGIC